MKKAGIISQVRMTSTRLPGKVLLPIGQQPLLKYHIHRLAQSGFPVILATTTNLTDDVIADFAKAENLPFYRGDENNVLSRYYFAVLDNQLDIIVRVTSDCPLIDGKLVGEAIEKYRQADNNNLYLSNAIERTFPRGFDFEIFSFTLLKEAFEKANTSFQLEHVTPYIKEHAQHQHILLPQDFSNFRITVDTPEDFELIKILIEKYEAAKLNHLEIIGVLQKHPELVKINAHIEQKKN